jgi:hypothetical protein
MTDWVPWPKSVTSRYLTGTACDMLIGPCACGATHSAQEVALALHERDDHVARLRGLCDEGAIVCTTDCEGGNHVVTCALGRVLVAIGPKPQTAPQQHRPPDFYDCHGSARYVCECGTVEGLHEFGRHKQCEYFNHHCDECHKRGSCTAHDDDEACPDCKHFGEHGAECQWLG